jgi:hypothetical protein
MVRCRKKAHGPPSGQPRSRAVCPLGRISASLEGWLPPWANLHVARGLAAPSGESPPRSRAVHPFGRISASLEAPQARIPRAHSPDMSIKCSDTMRVLMSKVNPRHAVPLTPPRNRISALFRQLLPREAIPATVRDCVVRLVSTP